MLEIVFGLGLICGLIVISANNPIYSVFRLIGLFINAAVLLLTLEVDFLAFILLIVYQKKVSITLDASFLKFFLFFGYF